MFWSFVEGSVSSNTEVHHRIDLNSELVCTVSNTVARKPIRKHKLQHSLELAALELPIASSVVSCRELYCFLHIRNSDRC